MFEAVCFKQRLITVLFDMNRTGFAHMRKNRAVRWFFD
jgi:hypothetical protein